MFRRPRPDREGELVPVRADGLHILFAAPTHKNQGFAVRYNRQMRFDAWTRRALRARGRNRRPLGGLPPYPSRPWTSRSSSSAPGARCPPRGAPPPACSRVRRRAAAVRLRRGVAAPDAALDRPGPGGRDLRHPLPRRPLPRPPRAAQDLRPRRARAPAAGDRPARPGRAVRGPAADLRPARYEVELVELDRARPCSRRLRGARVRGRAPDDGLRLRAGRGPAARALRPRGRRAPGRRPGPDFSSAAGGEAVEGRRRAGYARAGHGRGPPRPQAGGQRGHRAVRDDAVAAHEAELLVHDGSFADEEPSARRRPATRPPGRRRSWPPEAGVDCSPWCTSPRATDVGRGPRRGARGVPATEAPRDFDLVEIPFPERGAPRLVEKGGARARRQPEPLCPAERRGRSAIAWAEATPGPPGGSAWPAGRIGSSTPSTPCTTRI